MAKLFFLLSLVLDGVVGGHFSNLQLLLERIEIQRESDIAETTELVSGGAGIPARVCLTLGISRCCVFHYWATPVAEGGCLRISGDPLLYPADHIMVICFSSFLL